MRGLKGPPLTFDEAVAHFGSQAALARACGVSEAAVSHWHKRGCVPPSREALIASILSPASDAPPSSDGVPPSVCMPGGGIYCDEP